MEMDWIKVLVIILANVAIVMWSQMQRRKDRKVRELK